MKPPLTAGTDIVDVRRIGKLIKNKKFLARVFTREEIAYCREKRNAAQHFAVRLAAKEAVWKALGDRLNSKGVSHKEIGVRRSPSGKPKAFLSMRLKKYEPGIALSLSHTREYAVAVAIFSP